MATNSSYIFLALFLLKPVLVPVLANIIYFIKSTSLSFIVFIYFTCMNLLDLKCFANRYSKRIASNTTSIYCKSRGSLFCTQITVCLPLPAKSLAVSLPIPVLAPVTIAVFPSRRTFEDHFGTNTDLRKLVRKDK